MLQEFGCGCETCHNGSGTCVDKISLFDSLTVEQKNLILSKSVHKNYAKGELVFSPGDPGDNLYIINSGEIKIYKLSNQGKEQIIHVLKAKDFLGEHALFNNNVLQNTAEALKAANICILKGADIRELILAHPQMGLKILEQYAKKNVQALDMIESIGLYDVEQRIAKYILDLAKETESHLIKLPFSKGTLANIIGTTQETLSRKLSSLQDEGIISLQGQRNITILDIKLLTHILEN
ncbi:MAG: Crp/Fnr family transcriptional regulator [Clostridiaceae bacterium]